MSVLDASFKPTEMAMSYEGDSIFYKELRMALMEKGIKVLKYNIRSSAVLDESFKSHTTETDHEWNHNARVYNDNRVEGSKYMISVTGSVNPNVVCLTGADASVHSVFIELTDLQTKEVIFTMKAKGFDSPCGYCRKSVYENIAEKIKDYFQKNLVK